MAAKKKTPAAAPTSAPAKAPAKPAAPAASGSYTHEQVTALIHLVHEKGFEEFELKQGGMKLRIVSQRSAPPPVVYASAPMPMSYAPQPMAAPAPAPAAPAPAAPEAKSVAAASGATAMTEEDANAKKVTSPMVGTFYRSPAPGARAFVEVGDRVEENTVLCIIEAMKLMNEIKAETTGVVKKVLVENGKPVEYGQALFVIGPG